MSEKSKKIFATNHDMGSAQAMVPALRVLKQQGYDVVTFASEALPDTEVPAAPALQIFKSAELEPKSAPIWTQPHLYKLFQLERPDLVLVGVSVTDLGSEKLAISAARQLRIPVAFIVETWPHRWLEVYGERDIPLYKQAQLGLLWDQFSCDHMTSLGFDPAKLVATGNPSQDSFASYKKDRDKHRREMREKLGIGEEDVVIQWSMALDLDDPAQDRPGHPEWMGFYEAESVREFLEAMRDVSSAPTSQKVRGVIRQKPSHGSERVRNMIADICPSVIFDNDRETGTPLLLASDIVVGPVTMMVQNAVMLGVPGLFYFPDLCKPDPMIANALGFTMRMSERGDLRRLVRWAADTRGLPHFIANQLKPLELQTDATGNVVRALNEFLHR